MKILVTGATGFIGRHVVSELLKNNYDVIAVSRDKQKAETIGWYNDVEYHPIDIYKSDISKEIELPDYMIHLAWSGLPDYKLLFHFEENLLNDYNFIKKIVIKDVKHILVTGTCFEYGMKNGKLSEDFITNPINPYGLAKDTLRKFLQELQKKHSFVLQWVRLFYVYGEGQNSKSIFPMLEKAIDNNDKVFNMSNGEQLRDYLPVEEVAKTIVKLFRNKKSDIINCCSGKPISIRSLVEKKIAEKKSAIKLNLGYYPYLDYEPMAFWGDRSKLDKILGE